MEHKEYIRYLETRIDELIQQNNDMEKDLEEYRVEVVEGRSSLQKSVQDLQAQLRAYQANEKNLQSEIADLREQLAESCEHTVEISFTLKGSVKADDALCYAIKEKAIEAAWIEYALQTGGGVQREDGVQYVR